MCNECFWDTSLKTYFAFFCKKNRETWNSWDLRLLQWRNKQLIIYIPIHRFFLCIFWKHTHSLSFSLSHTHTQTHFLCFQSVKRSWATSDERNVRTELESSAHHHHISAFKVHWKKLIFKLIFFAFLTLFF